MGLKEGVGQSNNTTIMDWADDLDISFPDDETPWCGLFVGHCMGSAMPNETLPAGLLRARNWQLFGVSCAPQLGSTLVFWRVSPQDGRGHVGFYWAQDRSHYHVLGGNQSNMVSVTRVAKDRFLGARWPASLPTRGIIREATAKGVLTSISEQ